MLVKNATYRVRVIKAYLIHRWHEFGPKNVGFWPKPMMRLTFMAHFLSQPITIVMDDYNCKEILYTITMRTFA